MKKRSDFAVAVEILLEGIVAWDEEEVRFCCGCGDIEGIVAWDEEEVRFCCGCGDTPRGNSSLG